MPAIEFLRWLIVLSFCAVLTVAGICDIRERRIPNWAVLAVVILFLPWIVVGDVTILSAVGACLIVFAGSIALYMLGIVGAGDAKLISAVALFVGFGRLGPFLVLVALAGGLIALISLLSQPARALALLHTRKLGDPGQGVPYGVAIAIGAIGQIALPWIRAALA